MGQHHLLQVTGKTVLAEGLALSNLVECFLDYGLERRILVQGRKHIQDAGRRRGVDNPAVHYLAV